MAKIKLSELGSAVSELLHDSESFLTELSDPELENVVGGNSLVVIVKSPPLALVPIIKEVIGPLIAIC